MMPRKSDTAALRSAMFEQKNDFKAPEVKSAASKPAQ
jgi:hypothetical protein